MKKYLCFFLILLTLCSLSYARINTQQKTTSLFNSTSGSLNEPPLIPMLSLLLFGRTVPITNYFGNTQNEAEAAIVAAGLVVGTVTTSYSDTVAPGNVISQDPPADSDVPLGTEINLTISLGPEMVMVPNVVGKTQTDAKLEIVLALLNVGTITTTESDTIPLDQVISQIPAAGTTVQNGTEIRFTCSLGDLPPNPTDIASEVKQTETTSTMTATEFLYTGSDPVQTGVDPGTIKPTQVAVLRGKVLDKTNNPLYGATLSLLNQPQFGQTISRADGMFDLAVNGGGPMVVNYTRQGYLPAQRQIIVPWQDYISLPDVVMIKEDVKVNSINLDSTSIQVAVSSVTSDADGTRKATLLFPQGTSAEMVMPDGSRQSLSTLSVRATEYTVGENGQLAMPAEMPSDVAYTYAVELSIDEAKAAGAKRVDFNQPLPFYVENFLGFPVGGAVPLGYYDTDQGVWVPSENGRVIKILSINGGIAELDTTGNGIADNGSTIGVSDEERRQIALLYPLAGTSLWRMQLTHFSTWDANWGWGGPPGAEAFQLSDKLKDFMQQQNVGCLVGSCSETGSIIETQNQILGEVIDIAGSEFALHYRSDRVDGRKTGYTVNIPVSTDTLPPGLKRIDLEINVAGRSFPYSLPAQINTNFPFTWDGKDAYDREVQGAQPLNVRIGYVYDGSYQGVSQMLASFGYKGNGVPIGVNSRGEFIMWRDLKLSIGTYQFQDSAVGSWTPTIHHVYDPAAQMLYFGDGSKRSAQGVNEVVELIAGTGTAGFSGDDDLATSARINLPHDVVVAPDGSLFFSDGTNDRVRKVNEEGIISTVMSGVNLPIGVAIGLDGSLYVSEYFGHQIHRLTPEGGVEVFAGTGSYGFSGDGGPATAAQLNFPQGLAVGADGSLYIADVYNNRIRRVSPDGIIHTVAGSDTGGYGGDGGPATDAVLNIPCRVHVAAAGSLYIADTYGHRIRKVATDGIISTIAGTGVAGYTGDNGPATAAEINFPNAVSTSSDGSIYIGGYNNDVIRRVGPDGIITTVAGTGVGGSAGVGNPARQAQIDGPSGLSFAVDGSYFIADRNTHRILRVRPPLPGYSDNDLAIPSKDGSVIYHFNANGRHLRTVNVYTGATLYQFAYDTAGRLITITDGDNNITTIERDGSGDPTAIIAPFGQRSTLTLDSNGYLATLTNPLGHQYQMTYTNDGLLTNFQDPRSYVSTMTYDSQGRLSKDQNAANGFTDLVRTDNSDNYLVTTISAEGRTQSYQVGFLGDGKQNRVNQFPDGSQNQVLIANDGSSQITLADGTVTTTMENADPRFGMQTPILKSQTTATGGLTSTTTSQRSVTLSDPTDPMSLLSQTDSTTVNGHTTSSVYVASSRTNTTTSPMGRQNMMTMDNQGRPLQIDIPGITPVNFNYDSYGNLSQLSQGARESNFTISPTTGYLVSSSNPLNQVTNYSRDDIGRITTLTLPDTTAWNHGWDEMDNLTVLTEPNGTNQHQFTYTPINLLESYRSPLGAVESFSYNNDRQLVGRTYPSGTSMNWLYNDQDQLTTVQTPQGNHSFSYNGSSGQLSQAISRDGQTIDYSYSGGLVTGTLWSGMINSNVAYSYNNDLLLSQIQYGGTTLPLSYDNDNLLTGIGSISLNRDGANGLLTGLTDGGFQISYGYNGYAEVNSVIASHGAMLYDTSYSYDSLGRISQKIETIGSASHTWDYVYNSVGQLTTVSRDSAPVETYGYDGVGNRISINNSLTGETLSSSDYNYDADSKLLSAGTTNYSYDADGQLSQVSGEHSYHYHLDGTLSSVDLAGGGLITYQYDHLGRQIIRNVDGVRTHNWLYGRGLMPLAEYENNGSLRTLFIYGNGATPTTMIRGGNTYHIISDHLSSPRLVVDNTGTVIKQLDYDSYGNVINDTNPGFDLVFGFAGGMSDPSHELIRFGARDYQPSTGRWTAKDPILFKGGENFYLYVHNDPVNFIDRSGLEGAWSSYDKEFIRYSKMDDETFKKQNFISGSCYLSDYTRQQQEFEADNAAINYAVQSGYHKKGLIGFLLKIAYLEKGVADYYKETGTKPHWLTRKLHPPAVIRIKKIEEDNYFRNSPVIDSKVNKNKYNRIMSESGL